MVKHNTFLFRAAFFILLLVSFSLRAQVVFINEIHYDNPGSDTLEGVELAGPAHASIYDLSLVLYNGSDGTAYQTLNLSGHLGAQADRFGFEFVNIRGMRDGADGLALVDSAGHVIQFLSYEGAFVATNGPAAGLTSQNIGVSQSDSTFGSLQLKGLGETYTDFSWSVSSATSNDINNEQRFPQPPPPPPVAGPVFINEIHYDNNGQDSLEGIELAGRYDMDLTGWQIVLYDGSNGMMYDTIGVNGTLSNHVDGFGFLDIPRQGIQNILPGGIALVNQDKAVVQFLSYGGVFTAKGGPADSLTSTDIGIMEDSSTAEGRSLQLTGFGKLYEDFTWKLLPETFGAVNEQQTFSDTLPPPPMDDSLTIVLPGSVMIYENVAGYDSVTLMPVIKGGTAPFKFEWSTGQTSDYITVAAADSGIVHVQVIDSLNNIAIASVQITVVRQLMVTNVPDSVKLYLGYEPASTYKIKPIASYGMPPYNFAWSNGTNEATIDVKASDKGKLSLKVTDSSRVYVVDKTVNVTVENIGCPSRSQYSRSVLLCKNGQTICIPTYTVESYKSRGYTLGPCENKPQTQFHVVAYSNPFSQWLDLRFEAVRLHKVFIQMVDIRGRVVYTKAFDITPSQNTFRAYLSKLPPGVYTLHVLDRTDRNYRESLRVVKQ